MNCSAYLCWVLGLQQQGGGRDPGDSEKKVSQCNFLSRSQSRKGLNKMKTMHLAVKAQHGVHVLLGLDLDCVSVLLKNISVGCLGTQSLDRIFYM